MNDVIHQVDALITRKHVWSSDQLLHFVLALAAKGAIDRGPKGGIAISAASGRTHGATCSLHVIAGTSPIAPSMPLPVLLGVAGLVQARRVSVSAEAHALPQEFRELS